jgi:hypothetical protein
MAQEKASVRPVFHAVKWLAASARAQAVSVESDDPAIAVLAMRMKGRLTLLIANLSAEDREAGIAMTDDSAIAELLDADHPEPREKPFSGTLHLGAFAIVRIRL